MGVEVFTEEWSHACRAQLNGREGYRAAAAEWTDAVVLHMRADPAHGIPSDRAVFLELQRGECRDARMASAQDLASAPIVLAADAGSWRRVLEGGMDPVAAVMSGALRLERGNLLVLARYAGAAREMLAAAAAAGGSFPA